MNAQAQQSAMQLRTACQIAAVLSGATAVLRGFALDSCCRGNVPLDETAQARGLDPDEVIQELDGLLPDVGAMSSPQDTAELIDHILSRDHDVRRHELSKLLRLSQKVGSVQSDDPRAPHGLAGALGDLRVELMAHIQREATILFPAMWQPRADWQGGPTTETRSITASLFVSTIVISLFFVSALMWGVHAHLSEVVYWRWWLVRVSAANIAVLFATVMFMSSGVLDTLLYLCFVGTPKGVVALRDGFSALEVVPLAYIGFEVSEAWKLGKAAPWMALCKWPIMYFIAVSFWNLVGAGLFEFLINPSLLLYYMQGMNLTPLHGHGHTALFGVCGMVGISLVLLCLRGLRGRRLGNTRRFGTAFWTLNIGLAWFVIRLWISPTRESVSSTETRKA